MIHWGVIGPGGIAARFADAMANVDEGQIVAVSSRSLDRANAFADRYGIAGRYDDDQALAANPGVDAVYVATPHSRHEHDAVAMLQAGKHVLCEKPFAVSAPQAQRMVEAARTNERFLMEAIWSRFLPAYEMLSKLVDDGRIGTPLQVDADFGFRMAVDPDHRLFDLHQGGGALLDLGIYPLQLCASVLGPIDRIAAGGVIGSTGVDEQVAAVLSHRNGGLGVIRAAVRASLACTARITGSDGWIDLPAFMHCPTSLTVHAAGRDAQTFDCAWDGDGIEGEIREVHRCLVAGDIESPRMALADSVALMTAMDEIREQIGLHYPDGY